MKLNRLLIGTILGVQFTFAAFADDVASTNGLSSDIQALKKEIQSLEQKVSALELQSTQNQQSAQVQDLDQKFRVLERKREIDEEAATATAATTPKITLGANGFGFSSADSNFVATLHGLVQFDSRTFFNDHGIKGNDSFILRRARPIFTGTVYHDFDFVLVPEFGSSTVQILDAFVNYRYQPELQLQAGKFKSPVGLEALQSDTATFFNERSLVTDLLPNRDVGAELHGDLFGGAVGYAAGIFNGAPDFSTTATNADYEDNKAFAGRIFFQPWKTSDVGLLKGFGFGVGGSYESDRAVGALSSGLTSGYTTDGQQKFFTYTNGVLANGTHWRISPQAYYCYGPFGILGEYAISDQRVSKGTASADLRNQAWEISGGWILTGEDASYTGITPRHPFNPRKNQWGAFQIVGRYADLDVDDKAFPTFANPNTSASAAHAWSAGINWYLNKNIRVNASYSHTIFDGGNGTGATVTKQPENVFFTRIQLAF
ncbi:MAG TPA: porin [Methylomirabilota bacterium]|nr:porin [Methylomirabilota bacterium]